MAKIKDFILVLILIWISYWVVFYERTMLLINNSNYCIRKYQSMDETIKHIEKYTTIPTNNGVRTFNPVLPKYVLLLAYQRVGSTFLGTMFNTNRNMMYTYEPLDSVYTRLFGIEHGWAVPSDIHFHWNGTYRPLLKDESDIIAELIEQIFTCNYTSMIGEHLINEFWSKFDHKEANMYAECIKFYKVSVAKCRELLYYQCPSRLGQELEKQEMCYRELKLAHMNESKVPLFMQYTLCIDFHRKHISNKCVPKITYICQRKQVKVIKTVRLQMETIEHLMDKYPNMRIIHLIRDPKPVVLSRFKTDWATSGSTYNVNAQRITESYDKEEIDSLNNQECVNLTTPKDIMKEAKLYCSLVLRDVLKRQEIESKYPGSTYQLIYEHFTSDPLHEMKLVYKFLDELIPSEVYNWVNSSTTLNNISSKAISQRWQEEISVRTANIIDDSCQELYKYI